MGGLGMYRALASIGTICWPAGWPLLASASRPHLLIEDALLLGLRFGPLTTFLAALLACLLTCVRVAWFTPPY